MLKLIISLLLAISVTSLTAQEEFVPAPSVFLTRFPFKLLTGGIIIIKARVDNIKDSLNFILDTGSGGISLDSTTVARLNIKTTFTDRTIRGIAGIRKVRFAFDRTLHLPGLNVDSLDFHINDYELLTSVYGEKIDGIIGYSFLSRYIVHIDYDSLKIAVHSRGRIRYPKGGYLMRPFIVNIPVTNAFVKDVNEVNSRFYFDTGAGMCVLLSSDFVTDSLMLRTNKKWYVSQAEGLGGKAPMKQGVVKQVRVGPYKFKNVPAYVFDDEYNITSYPYLGGLLGNDLLRRFNLIINYEKRDIHLLPNSHFREQFDYSYTGLGMYVIDGVIKIVDVMRNSPAEKGGFLTGDIIVAVENNFSQNIQTYKNMMQNPGERIKITIYRNGQLMSLVLRVMSVMR